MKIYIAGHREIVGSAILRRLKQKGFGDIVCRTSRELDLRRQSDTERFFEDERPEHVYMAATKVDGIIADTTYTADFIYDNIAIALNAIHSAHKYGVKKLLNLGSSCVYPRAALQPTVSPKQPWVQGITAYVDSLVLVLEVGGRNLEDLR